MNRDQENSGSGGILGDHITPSKPLSKMCLLEQEELLGHCKMPEWTEVLRYQLESGAQYSTSQLFAFSWLNSYIL